MTNRRLDTQNFTLVQFTSAGLDGLRGDDGEEHCIFMHDIYNPMASTHLWYKTAADATAEFDKIAEALQS